MEDQLPFISIPLTFFARTNALSTMGKLLVALLPKYSVLSIKQVLFDSRLIPDTYPSLDRSAIAAISGSSSTRWHNYDSKGNTNKMINEHLASSLGSWEKKETSFGIDDSFKVQTMGLLRRAES